MQLRVKVGDGDQVLNTGHLRLLLPLRRPVLLLLRKQILSPSRYRYREYLTEDERLVDVFEISRLNACMPYLSIQPLSPLDPRSATPSFTHHLPLQIVARD